ncbi:MAG: hypothetical protein GQ564_15010 [Bacteroidales bacterium]|nr:hypothetical protein [Bacteroidales bacterium]
MEYFLSKLNDREFESLAGDIISKHLNLNVEKFKAGKDGGVDGRFWIGKKEGIIQCKHFSKTGYQGLISKLKKEEVNKVKKLNPKRYLFLTSVPLSRINKKEIFSLFFPFIKYETDIWGEDDINSFLSNKENQAIVEKNYKLWITSTHILEILINNAIKGRSESTIREMEAHNEKYVVTENHLKGFEILKENNVIIITGDPGIGKTTLANNLALYYVANEFEFCDIEESISEAEDLLREREKKKIIFYCDDFLGSNMYDAISNKRDSHIVKFINRIKRDNSKKFILTSRTNILTKAISLSHQFQNNNITEDELLITIKNLSELDKAKILYNHIYHSNLDNIYIDQIYKEKRYKKIIKHRNYNPRIIEFITDNRRIYEVKPEQYWDYITDKLENPEEIWSCFFQNQVDDSVRVLSFLTVFNGSTIPEDELRRSYTNFKNNFRINLVDHTDISFNAVRKLAIKSLLNRSKTWNNNYIYSLFNPSIGDFIINSYLEDVDLVISILKSLGTNSSINFLNSLKLNKRISSETIQQFQLELFNYFYEAKIVNEEWDYLILLSYLDFLNPKIADKIDLFLKSITKQKESTGNSLYELLTILVEFFEVIEIKDCSFLSGFVKNIALNKEDIEKLLEFLNIFNIEDDPIISIIEEGVSTYLIDALRDDVSSISLESYISQSYDEDGDVDYEIDSSVIESELESLLDSIISDFEDESINCIDIVYSDILANFDIQKIEEDFFSSLGDQYDDDDDDDIGRASSYSNKDNDIEAIFERS